MILNGIYTRNEVAWLFHFFCHYVLHRAGISWRMLNCKDICRASYDDDENKESFWSHRNNVHMVQLRNHSLVSTVILYKELLEDTEDPSPLSFP